METGAAVLLRVRGLYSTSGLYAVLYRVLGSRRLSLYFRPGLSQWIERLWRGTSFFSLQSEMEVTLLGSLTRALWT